jgi:hypothetical protein
MELKCESLSRISSDSMQYSLVVFMSHRTDAEASLGLMTTGAFRSRVDVAAKTRYPHVVRQFPVAWYWRKHQGQSTTPRFASSPNQPSPQEEDSIYIMPAPTAPAAAAVAAQREEGAMSVSPQL